MRNYILAGAGLFAVAASPALAQSSPDDAPFGGFYVGASGGYDVQPNDVDSRILFDRNLDGNFNESVVTAAGPDAFGTPVGGFCNGAATAGTSPTNPTAPARCRNDRDGWSYNARAGYDTQMGNIVAGVVGEFGKSNVRDSVTAFSTTPASYTMTREVDWEANVRGRVGYAANTTLFYGTAGVGYAKIASSFATTNTANAFTESNDDMRWGGVFGGGVEQKLGRNLSVGLEYLGHVYNDRDYRVRAGSTGTTPATNPFILAPNTTGTDFRRSDDKFRWHSMRATAAFRF